MKLNNAFFLIYQQDVNLLWNVALIVKTIFEEDDLYTIGDGFTLEEAIVLVQNNVYNYAEIA